MKRLFALAFALCALASPSLAQSADSREAELATIEKRLKDRAAEEKRLKNEAAAREKEVAALRVRMIEAANSLQNSERRMGEIAGEIERLTGEEAGLAASLSEQQANLGDVLAALQSMELSRPPALFVSPEDANKAARAAMLLADAAPVIETKARALRGDLEALKAVRAERDRERAAFEKSKGEVSARRRVLADLLRKKQEERDVAASLAAAAQKETAALASRATTLKDVLRRLDRLARAITPRLKPAPRRDPEAAAPPPVVADQGRRPESFSPSRPFARARGSLRPPVVGKIVGAFGSVAGGQRLEGMRFAVPDEAIVTAPFEASVVFARSWNPVGNLIVLDVGGGYHILLMGVSAFLVKEGQRVAAGEPLAEMAADPGAKEARLDLEIRKNGEPVNPSLWLSRKTDGTAF